MEQQGERGADLGGFAQYLYFATLQNYKTLCCAKLSFEHNTLPKLSCAKPSAYH
jgi:hypothetical protein